MQSAVVSIVPEGTANQTRVCPDSGEREQIAAWVAGEGQSRMTGRGRHSTSHVNAHVWFRDGCSSKRSTLVPSRVMQDVATAEGTTCCARNTI